MIKTAQTQYPVIDLIKNRWSPRSFMQEEIDQKDVNTLLEAASWAPSAMNEQPWEYIYAHRGTAGFETLKNCLLPGNSPWAKDAAVLLVSMARTMYTANQKINASALHDVGMANAQLLLQAQAMNIYGHMMGGFDQEKLRSALSLQEHQQAICVIALGYLDIPEKLEEPFKTRELQARQRKSLQEIAKELAS
jgi:nitroreductase